MHMQGEPRSMQNNPHYDDVVAEVHAFLAARVCACEDAGIERGHIVVDPGFGFGKNRAHNLTVLRELASLGDLATAVYVGLSRKATIGAITGRARPADRVGGSVAAALIAVQHGARMLRVHDVGPTVDALAVWHAAESAADPSTS
jgi:dihydropteroate synthase